MESVLNVVAGIQAQAEVGSSEGEPRLTGF